MNRLRWHLLHVWRSIGIPGWSGAAIVLACAGLWLGVTAPLGQELERLDAARSALERRGLERVAPVAAAATAEQQLASFTRRFPDEKAIVPALARMNALALQRGVAVEQAEFRYVSDPGEPLARYTIVLPVKAEYRALRRFIQELLREMPGLALEEVNLRRSDAKGPLLESQLRLVLFLGKAG